MNKKYFILNPERTKLSHEERKKIREDDEKLLRASAENYRKESSARIKDERIKLKHVEERIIIKIDIDSKDVHRFDSGVEIYRGRRFNNLNRRETEPVNAWVVNAENISSGCEILIHPNAICDANKIFNYGDSGIEQGNSVRYYSIEEISAFLFRDGETWRPIKNFATALRVFKPYTGIIEGIPPGQIENVLYLTSGELNGKVCQTVKAADYEIIFTGTSGQEQRIIRCRHYENESHDREEIIIVRHDLTDKVKKGELLIGLSPTDCKKLSERPERHQQ